MTIEQKTGNLFGKLFPAYDDARFKASLELFKKRFAANAFPLKWFRGKKCLDAGCGGGRYSIALCLLGAKQVVGIDLAPRSLRDAVVRAKKLGGQNIIFKKASLERIPYPNQSFDCVISSGVIHHMPNPEKAMAEFSRVLRPGGMLYLLVYATEGLRWPTIESLRPLAQAIGFQTLELAVAKAKLSVAARRTYLDDLLVPVIDFYSWPRLELLLKQFKFNRIKRWSKGRLDHEENLLAYENDVRGLASVFTAGARLRNLTGFQRCCFKAGLKICQAALGAVGFVKAEVDSGRISEQKVKKIVIGQGHHRLIAWKMGKR